MWFNCNKSPFNSNLVTLGLILEHFLKFLLKCFLRASEKQRKKKTSTKFMNAWTCDPTHRKSFLKLKARSRAPEFAYIHALPAPYKGMQLKCFRVDSVVSDCTRHYVACPYKERAGRVCMQIQVHENALSTSSGGAQLRTLLLLRNTFSGVHESGGDVFLTLVFRSP